MSTLYLAAALLAAMVSARTDLTGCTTTDLSSPAGASVAWYVPGTGEICAPLDCGGGMAPPKTNVPGCAAYSGTATYSPSYLPGYGNTASQTPDSSPAATATASASATPTDTAALWSSLVSAASTGASSWDLYTSTGAASGTASPLICAIASSCSSQSSSAYVVANGTITTQYTASTSGGSTAAPATGSGASSTVSNAPVSTGAAADVPGHLVGGAAFAAAFVMAVVIA